MPRLLLLAPLLLSLLSACASAPPAKVDDARPYALREQQQPLPLPAHAPPELPFTDSRSLLPQVEALYPRIGGWPPRYSSERERKSIYQQWVQLLQVGRVLLAREHDSESARFVLAELMRIGHNMDVQGAGEAAQQQIHACLRDYPDTIACHFAAVRYYLAVTPLQLDKAETSLLQLRGRFNPEFNEEVERGFVFLHLYRQDTVATRRQIDDYLAMFPQSPFVQDFQAIRARIVAGDPLKQIELK